MFYSSRHLFFFFASLMFGLLVIAACKAAVPTRIQTDSARGEPMPTEIAPSSADTVPSASGPSTALTDLGDPPPFDTTGWTTDFSQRSIPWSEIISGGPPKDGIPAIDTPTFESVAAAAQWLGESDPVALFQHNGAARAYPLAILIWHEIVNDEVGGKPISVTFCPLCNASIVFSREFDGQILDFGTTGKLRNSDLIMYDRQSESWWQQLTGEALVGQYTGERLQFLASQVLSFQDFADNFPAGTVLQRPGSPGSFARSYGRNPYAGYDSSRQPFLFRGELDDRLPATERVVGVFGVDGAAMAFPFSAARKAQVIHHTFDGVPLVLFHKNGTASALDSGEISLGRDVGSIGLFDRRLGEQTLTFLPTVENGLFVDQETGSTWTILGESTSGELTGQQLTQIIAFDHFWFAWAAFASATEIHTVQP